MHGVRVETTLLTRGAIVEQDRLAQSLAQEVDTEQPAVCSVELPVSVSAEYH